VGADRLQHAGRQTKVDLQDAEKVEDERTGRKQVAPKPLLVNERAFLAVGEFAPDEGCDLRTDEGGGLRSAGSDVVPELAALARLGAVIAHRPAPFLAQKRLA